MTTVERQNRLNIMPRAVRVFDQLMIWKLGATGSASALATSGTAIGQDPVARQIIFGSVPSQLDFDHRQSALPA